MAKNHQNTFNELSDLSSLLSNNSASDHQNKQTNQQPNNQSTPKAKNQSQLSSPHSSPKQRKFRLSATIIDQYRKIEIFKRINPKELREADIVILHNLARKLLQNNPDLSSENILKNQIALYEFMRQKFREYNKTKRTDEDKNKMRHAIRKQSATLIKNPLINEQLDGNECYIENDKETHNKIIKAIPKKDKENKETSTPATDSVDSSQESKQTLSVEDKDENLPSPSPGNSHNTKLIWRRFTDNLADKLRASVEEEDTDDDIFYATITTRYSTTFIKATSSNNISLSAQDNDGDPTVPDPEIFYELAKNALKNHKIINFSNIQTPEFKARLMIACLKNNVIMIGQPKLDEEFLNSLDAEGKSAKYLKAYKNKLDQQQQQNQPDSTSTPAPTLATVSTPAPAPTPAPPPTPAPEAQSNYEKTRDEREKLLDIKSKTQQGLTPAEQHELDYMNYITARAEAKEEAISRTGDEDEPRTAEHTKKSGYAPKDYPFFPKDREWNGWKLHLDVVPNRDEPTTKAVSEFLEELKVDHKIAHGGKNGKGMTIYVGSYDDTVRLANEINSRFGKDIAEPPLYTDQKCKEIDFNKKVTGRFFLQGIYHVQYPTGSIRGLCPADLSRSERPMSEYLSKLAIEQKIVASDNPLFYHYYLFYEDNDFHDKYVFDILESYCSHKLYQKHLGEFYCGKDADKFEEQIFGGAQPPKGSKDRATWDKIADLYIQKSKNDYPRGIQAMQELKSKYTPIDFTKVPPLVRPQKSNTGNQP